MTLPGLLHNFCIVRVSSFNLICRSLKVIKGHKRSILILLVSKVIFALKLLKLKHFENLVKESQIIILIHQQQYL